jgi:hypothetical protein
MPTPDVLGGSRLRASPRPDVASAAAAERAMGGVTPSVDEAAREPRVRP